MLIPEIIIFNTVNNFLQLLTEDYNAANGSDPCTMLYEMFYNDDNEDRAIFSTYDWFVQAKDLLLRGNNKVRKLDVNIGYNLKREGMPTIHILLPSESKGRFDSIGMGETNAIVKNQCTSKLWIKKKTSHTSVYHLMITSDNSSEVLVIYYFLKYMFTMLHDHFGLKGLLNISFSGQDVNVQQDLVPANIYHRNFSIQFDYENIVTVPIKATLVNGISFKVCDNLEEDNREYPHSGNG